MRRVLAGTVVALALAATTIIAAPQSTTSSIVLNVPPAFRTSASWPALGDLVSFTVSYPKTLDHFGVRVQVLCYNGNGDLTFATAGAFDEAVKLGGDWSPWKEAGGGAECQADLYYWSYTKSTQKFNLLASTNFTVGG